MENVNSIKMSALAEEDRPREKLLQKGKGALTDAELIAILIGSGTRSLSAVDLSRQILSSIGNDLSALARLSVKDLQRFKGIGEAKAISIVSAMELGRRRKMGEMPVKPKIGGSREVYELMKPYLLDESVEYFYAVLLNRSNKLLKVEMISQGGMSGTVADPKLVFRAALAHGASSIILVHNHPSGTLYPSKSDIDLTEKLKRVGISLELPVVDHVIFTDVGYFSFSDKSMM